MKIKYNTDPAGNIKVVTRNGNVSCECCCLFGPPPDPTIGVEITKDQFGALLRGGVCAHSNSATFAPGSQAPTGPCFESEGASGTTGFEKNICFIGTFNVGGNAVGLCRFWAYEGKYRFIVGTGSFTGDRFLYLTFSENTPIGGALIPNHYLSDFTGSVTIDGESIGGNWYNSTGSCGYSDGTGSVESASISINITTNAP